MNPGDEVTFSAAGSGDLDGALINYTWRLSDGTVLDGMDATHRFDASGPIDVTLTVQDDSGSACATSTDTLRVLVNTPPEVDAGFARDTLVGAAHDVLVFDATSATDADGHGLAITWDFGDGVTATGAIVRHAYAAPGSYTVTVTARDSTGLPSGIASDTTTVTARSRGDAAGQ